MESLAEDHPVARYKNPADAGRAPSPGPDFTGWSQEEIKKERHRAGERWTDAESAKIIELRGAPKYMPWKQVSKVVAKTPLACRLRMNQLKKQKKQAVGLAGPSSAKSGRRSKKQKTPPKSASPPQAPRQLEPAAPKPQRALPPFQPLAETSTFTPVLPSLRDLQADRPAQFANQEREPMTYWSGVPYQQPPQQPYQQSWQSSTYGIDRLSILAGAAHDADRQLPTFSSPLPFRHAEAGPRFSTRQDSAPTPVAEPTRKLSNVYELLNEEESA